MSDNITESNLVNLKEKIEKLIQTSPYDEVKSFFNSTTGKFLIDVLEISNSSMNYTNDLLKDESFFQTMTEYDSVVKKASSLGYHIKRMIPAKIKYNIEVDDPENRLNGVSKIVFKGREFTIDKDGINLVQENSYTKTLADKRPVARSIFPENTNRTSLISIPHHLHLALSGISAAILPADHLW